MGGYVGGKLGAAQGLVDALAGEGVEEAGGVADEDVAGAGGAAGASLAPRQVGALMFPIAQRFVAAVVLVSDDAIRAAQQALWQTLRVVAEPGGATAFAALLSGRYRPRPGAR